MRFFFPLVALAALASTAIAATDHKHHGTCVEGYRWKWDVQACRPVHHKHDEHHKREAEELTHHKGPKNHGKPKAHKVAQHKREVDSEDLAHRKHHKPRYYEGELHHKREEEDLAHRKGRKHRKPKHNKRDEEEVDSEDLAHRKHRNPKHHKRAEEDLARRKGPKHHKGSKHPKNKHHK